ncbi:MAG: glycosyltransferase family 1 protein, partial [Bacteroidia bacterium]|nr:glycosyltransferase family 1 protein [Bacteroidia bacterium]
FLVDPANTEEIASAIHEVLTNLSLRDTLIEKGYHQAQKFSWQKMTTQVIELYKEVLDSNMK